MRFCRHTPCVPLRAFVDDFWLYEDYAGDPARERILPSGTFELVFNLREDELRIYDASDPDRYRRFAGAVVSGPYSEPFMSDIAEEAAIMGVHFRPGGAFAILGPLAGELADSHVDLRAVWGPAATELRERLCAATGPAARFRLLESALVGRLFSPGRHHGAVRVALDVLMRTHGRARIRDIANTVDLSQRRFIDVFTTEVGLTPKLFGRVQRFQHAVSRSRAATADWAGLAIDCGYFDQSHLIRDFIQFAGVSPAEFRKWHIQLDRSGVHVKRHHLPSAE